MKASRKIILLAASAGGLICCAADGAQLAGINQNPADAEGHAWSGGYTIRGGNV